MEVRYIIFNKPRWKFYSGVKAQFLSIRQEPKRKNENEIINAGYPSMPVYRANMSGLGGTAGVQFNLPLSISLQTGIAPSIYLGKDINGNIVDYFRVPLNFSVGFRF